MSTQTTIFDQTEQRKLAGIELVYAHADTIWKQAAAKQIQYLVGSANKFTSDDVLIPLEQRGITTGDTRALAAILKAFQRAGYIEATQEFTTCRRPSRHHAPIRVWRVV